MIPGYSLCLDGKFEVVRAACEGLRDLIVKAWQTRDSGQELFYLQGVIGAEKTNMALVPSWIRVHDWRTIEKKLKENVIRIVLLNLNSNNFTSSRSSCIKLQEFRGHWWMILNVSQLSYNQSLTLIGLRFTLPRCTLFQEPSNPPCNA